jgi:hypothetical protein
VCGFKVAGVRQLEVGAVVAAAQAMGYGVALLTLTARHHKGQRLTVLWTGVMKAWGSVTSGKCWVAEQDAVGLVGWVRVTECTHGEANGWHPHLHVLLIGERLDGAGGDALFRSMWARWSRSLVRSGLDAPVMKASDMRMVTGDFSATRLGEYLSKGMDAGAATEATARRVGMELTQTQSKVARFRHSTVTPWTILEAASWGESWALEAWWEWEKASKSKRQISYSKGLREKLGLLAPVLDDEEIAEQELGTEDDEHVVIEARGWRRLVANPDWIPEMLTVLERVGWNGLGCWLVDRQIEHRRV